MQYINKRESVKSFTTYFYKGDITGVSEHISNIFKEGELVKSSVVRDFRTTTADGKTYNVKYYNLGVIISVGYCVNSYRENQFRIWATERLREYVIKGFTLNDAWLLKIYL